MGRHPAARLVVAAVGERPERTGAEADVAGRLRADHDLAAGRARGPAADPRGTGALRAGEVVRAEPDAVQREQGGEDAGRLHAPVLPAAAGAVLQLVDAARSVGLRGVVGALLAGLARQRLQVRRLRAGHRLVAGRPVVRVLLGRALSVLIHARRLPGPTAAPNVCSYQRSSAAIRWPTLPASR